MASSPDPHPTDLKLIEYGIPSTKEDKVEIQPLAFTVQFEDHKQDSNRKLHIHDKLSKFALKHRRNPSLPDFGNSNKKLSKEEKVSPLNLNTENQVLKLPGNRNGKTGYYSEGYFSSDQEDEISKNKINSAKKLNRVEKNVKSVNLAQERKKMTDQLNQSKLDKYVGESSANSVGNCKPVVTGEEKLVSNRRYSLNNDDRKKYNLLDKRPSFSDIKPENFCYQFANQNCDEYEVENKSDTVSEAGTYTLDKDEHVINDLSSPPLENNEHLQAENLNDESEDEEIEEPQIPSSYHKNHKWINDWVCQVAKQNFNNYNREINSSGSKSPNTSKIPSPISSLPKSKGMSNSKSNHLDLISSKLNTSPASHHRRSSSLSAKDYNEYKTSDTGTSSSLETQSFLRTTESVVSAMQARMKLSDNANPSNHKYAHQSLKQRLHHPSASDTDTNSENDGKHLKKSLGNLIPSTRLNRAFSLRRARVEPELDSMENKKKTVNNLRDMPTKQPPTTPELKRNSGAITNPMKAKPPITSPFSRTDCGRFSTRTSANTPKTVTNNPKKEVKKSGTGGRSNSSLSSREVEFQNWKRRKSFDPMKAAAEGRKKELAKRAAMSQSVTQSVNLGSASHQRSGNPVLRSASFHSTPHQILASEEPEPEEEQISPDDLEYSPGSSWVSNHPVLPPNSPTKSYLRAALIRRPSINNSRGSLMSMVSATHSSPSRRAKLEALDNLVTSAISDLSFRLKGKSYDLLRKLSCAYDTDDDRSDRLRDEMAVLKSQQTSACGSPIQQSSRDLSTILKNLKSLENVFKVLDDVLFDESLEVYIDS